jgi:hypothetical protein
MTSDVKKLYYAVRPGHFHAGTYREKEPAQSIIDTLNEEDRTGPRGPGYAHGKLEVSIRTAAIARGEGE